MSSKYERVIASIIGGQLVWRYKLVDAKTVGGMAHDEDVSNWTDSDIKKLTRQTLYIEDDDPVEIQVEWC